MFCRLLNSLVQLLFFHCTCCNLIHWTCSYMWSQNMKMIFMLIKMCTFQSKLYNIQTSCLVFGCRFSLDLANLANSNLVVSVYYILITVFYYRLFTVVANYVKQCTKLNFYHDNFINSSYIQLYSYNRMEGINSMIQPPFMSVYWSLFVCLLVLNYQSLV